MARQFVVARARRRRSRRAWTSACSSRWACTGAVSSNFEPKGFIVMSLQGATAPRMGSVLCLLFAACGGMGAQKSTSPSSVAYSGGGGYSGGQPAAAEPSHGAVTPTYNEPAPDRPGLGTSWGEHVDAPISFAPFVRASSSPWAAVALHYNDSQGVGAHASYVGARPS